MTTRGPGLLIGCRWTLVAVLASGCAASRPSTSGAGARPSVAGAERVTFPSRDAAFRGGAPTEILGWLFRPAGVGSFPGVVAMHGCGGLYGRSGDLTPRHRDWAERLARSGYVVLLPDSFTPRGLEQICAAHDRPIRPGRERAADAYGALEYLQRLPFVRADRVALLGWSNGGSTVLAAVAAGAAARPPDLAQDFRVAVAFYPGCNLPLRDEVWTPTLPLHVLIGGADDWTPAGPCQALAERTRAGGGPMDVQVFAGAYHEFDAPGLPLRVRRNVATTATGAATVGTNEPARAAAIQRVEALFRRALVEGL